VEDIGSLRPAGIFPLPRAGFHRTSDATSGVRNSTYSLIRNFHTCGDGDGFIYLFK
jgi:hypothetical protein